MARKDIVFMLKINCGNGKRALPVLLLMVLLVQPLQAGAQQSGQDDKKPGKRPPLRVRVVTDARVGVPIVVAGGAQADGSTGEVAPANGIAVRLPGREIENWLTGGPPRQESWLNGTSVEPAQAPAEQTARNAGRDGGLPSCSAFSTTWNRPEPSPVARPRRPTRSP